MSTKSLWQKSPRARTQAKPPAPPQQIQQFAKLVGQAFSLPGLLDSANSSGTHLVGRSPWTARDALVPLLEAEAGVSERAGSPAPLRQGDTPLTTKRTRRQAGLTLIELIVAFSIMMVLTTMSVPLVRSQIRRNRERELRIALETMRKAIDKFKDAADKNQIAPTALTPESMGYPLKLQDLVEGVKGVGPNADVKVKFLRRIPRDPMTNSFDWGTRSMQDDPKSPGGGSQNVFDVFTKSTEKGLDGIPYSEW